MSNNHWLYCEDCDVESDGERVNWGNLWFEQIILNHAAICALSDDGYHGFQLESRYVPLTFLVQHRNHQLSVRNEYDEADR